jgi:hypothetical protein
MERSTRPDASWRMEATRRCVVDIEPVEATTMFHNA